MSDVPPNTPPPPPGGGQGTAPPPPPPQQPAGSPPPPSGGSDSERTIMLILAYVLFLGIIPMMTKKEDRDLQWHAKNGLYLFGAAFILGIIFVIVNMTMGDVIGCLSGFVNCIVGIGYWVIVIIAIIKATKGERLRLPVISDMADK